MRTTTPKTERGFEAKAISGIHTVLIALNCPPEACKGLKGFAFQREMVGSGSRGPKYLRSQKVFKSVVPDPKNALDPTSGKQQAFYTDKFPVQSFRWGDYAAAPGTTYRFRIQPMYGTPGALTTDPKDEISFEIATEKEWAPGETKHGVWFNRGAIASQKFAEEFGNKPPHDINNPDDPEVKWLSRGLLEACLEYINETKPGDALRVAAYEFTYPPILNALKALIDKGIDVQITYHDTMDEKQSNEGPMKAAGLPINDQKITYRRSKTKIPHNKFIVRLKNGTEPVEVWTGSTNFTPSGFLGQTNVGHRVADAETAQQYFEFWSLIKTDPELKVARTALAKLTPDPAEAIAVKSVARLFSPRQKAEMLGWYGRRMLDAANSVWFTAAFGISKDLIEPVAKKRDQMRFVLLEKPLPDAQRKTLTADTNRVVLSYGVPLGELYRMGANGQPTARMPIQQFALDKWFFAEELYRPKNDGFVFFVHTKFLLIDPLSDDPLVCSGSANFSSGSLLQNDENMLLVRGETRVADIYMTEFERIFQHFYFRNIANELAGSKKGDDDLAIFLDETDGWTKSYFTPGTQKYNKRLMFFATPTTTWFANASKDKPAPEPAKKKPAGKPADRKAPKKKTSKKKTTKKKKTKKAAPKKAKKKTAKKKSAKTAKRKAAKKTKKKAKKR
jgi:phosphatidylserine/phosphatidylglycerophosphate/cardiolipin synthase-like enzyme